MPTNHKGTKPMFDELTLTFDGVSTAAWTASDHDGAAVDLGAANVDELGRKAFRVDWPAIGSGGAATVVFAVQDSADGSTGWATIDSSQSFAFDDTEPGPNDYLQPIPAEHRRYVRLRVTVGTAALNAGVINAGVVPL